MSQKHTHTYLPTHTYARMHTTHACTHARTRTYNAFSHAIVLFEEHMNNYGSFTIICRDVYITAFINGQKFGKETTKLDLIRFDSAWFWFHLIPKLDCSEVDRWIFCCSFVTTNKKLIYSRVKAGIDLNIIDEPFQLLLSSISIAQRIVSRIFKCL